MNRLALVAASVLLHVACLSDIIPSKGDRLCQRQGDCFSWESYEIDACQLDAEDADENARDYGCEDRWKLVLECYVQTGVCSFDDELRQFVYDTNCNAVIADYQACI